MSLRKTISQPFLRWNTSITLMFLSLTLMSFDALAADKPISDDEAIKRLKEFYPGIYERLLDNHQEWVRGEVADSELKPGGNIKDQSDVSVTVPNGIDLRPYLDHQFIIFRDKSFIVKATAFLITKTGFKAKIIQDSWNKNGLQLSNGDTVQNWPP